MRGQQCRRAQMRVTVNTCIQLRFAHWNGNLEGRLFGIHFCRTLVRCRAGGRTFFGGDEEGRADPPRSGDVPGTGKDVYNPLKRNFRAFL
jgi:hypothetical protein